MDGRAPRGRGQAGYTLAEVIVAVFLISTVFLGVAGAVFTVTKGSATNERIQSIDTALATYSRILRDTDLKGDGTPVMPYRPCTSGGTGGSDAVAAQYEADVLAVTTDSGDPGDSAAWRIPDGMTFEVTEVHSWDPVAKNWTTNCAVPDKGAQRIRYKVVLGVSERHGETVKRYPGPTA